MVPWDRRRRRPSEEERGHNKRENGFIHALTPAKALKKGPRHFAGSRL
jgi:hypothetical protein